MSKKRIWLIAILACIALVFGFKSFFYFPPLNVQLGTVNKPVSQNADPNNLANLVYQPGSNPVIQVNGGKATLDPNSWHANSVQYAALDNMGRTSTGNTGYLCKANVTNDALRQQQTVNPTGWHQKRVKGTYVVNRGHIIAYSLSKGIAVDGSYNPNLQSGDQDNPKNLFTETTFTNQELQWPYEQKVQKALIANKQVVYQVTPVFKGINTMAAGVHMQAASIDGTLNYNVFLFNVQPNVKFNYLTGRSVIDNAMVVPQAADAPNFKGK